MKLDNVQKRDSEIINNSRFVNKGLLEEYSYSSIRYCINRLKKYDFFDPSTYETMNPDIIGKNVFTEDHAVMYGFAEGREILSKRKIVSFLGKEFRKNCNYEITNKKTNKKNPSFVGVFYHSKGNFYIAQLAYDLHKYLESSGVNSVLMTEKDRSEVDLCIFCGPHEFFFLGAENYWKKDEIISRSIMFNTEQVQTIWFTRGLIYILMSAAVIDVCFQNLTSFSKVGLTTFHFDPQQKLTKSTLPLLDRENPLIYALPSDVQGQLSSLTPFMNRSIDVSFFGNKSVTREEFFVRNASFFAPYNTFFYYRKDEGLLCNKGVYGIFSRLPQHIAKASKIYLNIHQDNFPFFEWQRIVKQGLSSGSIVVSEECFPHPLYKAGVHFFEENRRHIPNLVEWLIQSEDGKSTALEMQKNIFSTLRNINISKSKNLSLENFISTVWSKVK